jgi:hypothetical protein
VVEIAGSWLESSAAKYPSTYEPVTDIHSTMSIPVLNIPMVEADTRTFTVSESLDNRNPNLP